MDKLFAEKTLSKFRENYSQAHSTIDRLYEGEDRLRRLEIADYAAEAMAVAEEDFAQESYESAGQAAVLATTLLDLATSLTPGVSWARDAYEAISGKDLISGETLDTFGRSMAVIGIIPFVGIAGKFNKALKVVKKLMKGEKAGEVVKKSEKILDTAKKVGITKPEEVKILGKAMSAPKIDPFKLVPTHKITMSKKDFKLLKEGLEKDGVMRDTIKYVEHNGQKYIVDGHHRARAVKELQWKEVPVEKVDLPFKGYTNIDDLFN